MNTRHAPPSSGNDRREPSTPLRRRRRIGARALRLLATGPSPLSCQVQPQERGYGPQSSPKGTPGTSEGWAEEGVRKRSWTRENGAKLRYFLTFARHCSKSTAPAAAVF